MVVRNLRKQPHARAVRMLEKLVEAGVVFASIAGLSWLVGLAVASIVEQTTLRGLRGDGLEQRMISLTVLLSKFQRRRDQMLPQMVRLEDQLKSARRRHYMVTKRLSDLKMGKSLMMRVLGEEDGFLRPERPSRRFLALVINKHVQRAQLEQKEHPMLARSWARAQRVIVWAPTIGDAKVAVERSYPPAIGFFVIEISEPEDPDMEIEPKAKSAVTNLIEAQRQAAG